MSRRALKPWPVGATLGAVLVSACSGWSQPAPMDAAESPGFGSVGGFEGAAVLSEPGALFSAGFGRLAVRAADGTPLTAHIYRASGFDPGEGPIWFVMHGAKRNARRYLGAAAPVAERYGLLAVALEFPRTHYPRGNDYTLGVVTTGRVDRDASREGRWRSPRRYLYAEIERLFDAIRHALGGRQRGYYLFGHSAGAQFVHRLITFLPSARVLGAVAANAGWYTLPVRRGEARFAVPYGLSGAPPLDADAVLAAPLTVLLGTDDVATPDRDPLLRGTPEAMAQGTTRLQRGHHYFETGRSLARARGSAFGWRLVEAPGAGHEVTEVIASAGFLLFAPKPAPCRSSPAADAGALAFESVLADPPQGAAGDCNHDGVRDARADERVTLVNRGSTSLCLAGWTLSDAVKRRHLFPLGPPLQPGQRLVLFGGGVPTGRFDGALVQWASGDKGLSLSNSGDVLTLRDADGTVVRQVSWSD